MFPIILYSFLSQTNVETMVLSSGVTVSRMDNVSIVIHVSSSPLDKLTPLTAEFEVKRSFKAISSVSMVVLLSF